MRRPLLSVVIPTWNRAHLVVESIDSALAQRNEGVEVIVVDDCSTDDTLEVLAQRYGNRIRVIHLPRRGGGTAAKNVGARETRGEFVAFLDSDDVWLEGKLDAELAVFDRLPEADVVLSDNLFFLEGRQEAESRFESAANGLLEATGGRVTWMGDCHPLWTMRSVVSTCSMTLRRTALDRFGGELFAEDLLEHGDWEFEIRMFRCCKAVVLPQVWAHVRQIDDCTRPDRATPGIAPTPEQQHGFLRGRLVVLERALALPGFAPDIVAEFERNRDAAARELRRFERIQRHT